MCHGQMLPLQCSICQSSTVCGSNHQVGDGEFVTITDNRLRQ